MEFLKNHIEKLLLAIALVALMASAIMVAMRVGSLHGEIQINPPKQNPPPPIDQARLDDMLAQVRKPKTWPGGSPPLFISVPRWWDMDKKTGRRFLGTGEPPVLDDPTKTIPRQWFKEHGLDYKDPDIDSKDTDNDGWTNAEEYRFKTDPKSAESQPKPSDFLGFGSTIQNKFYLRFQGYSKGGANDYTFQINVNDFDHTYFVRAGQQIKDAQRTESYVVDRFEFEEKQVFDSSLGGNVTKEVSRLHIHRIGEEARDIVLTYRETSLDMQLKVRISPRVEPKQEIVRAKGEEFEFRGQTYKVVDIKNDGVLISDSLNREFNITAPKAGE